jgi:uncharacterized membrane protein
MQDFITERRKPIDCTELARVAHAEGVNQGIALTVCTLAALFVAVLVIAALCGDLG